MTDLLAVGDQVQAACDSSGQPIIAFVLLAADGTAEYRSVLDLETTRTALHAVAEAL